MTTTTPELAVTYGRSSSANEKSIGDQNDENRAEVDEHGWTIAEELSDPVSASRYGKRVRENWARVEALLPTVDVVVLWEPSRGSRTLTEWSAFLEACITHGVRIHATSHHRTYDPANSRDWLALAEDGVRSDHQSREISDRVNRGMRKSLALGKPAGKRDYGYERLYDITPKGPRVREQVPHPDEAPVVKSIFAEIESGVSMYKIAQRLDAEGVPTMRGARTWKPGVVLGMARNPIYRPHPDDPDHGCLVRKGQVHVGAWPPLVDESTWQAVQTILGTNSDETRQRRKDSPPGAIKYLLSASSKLLTCSHCGGDIVGSADRPARRPHYSCRLGHTAAPMPEADEFVTRLVVARLSKRDARHLWVADDTATKAAAKELARLEAQLAEALALYEADEISGKAYSVKEKKLAPLIAEARRRSQPAGAPLAALKLLDAARVSKDLVRPTWDGLELLAKREVIGSIFESLVLGPVTERITRWTGPGERLDIVSARISHEWRRP